ncbi:MAG: hypothetical protein ACRDYB_07040, partial [Acidimicrobiales bacterium]
LPRRSGFTWSAVALRAQSATGPPGSGTTPVATIPGPHGRTIALIDHAPVGGYTLFALATPACGPGPSCSAGGLVWTIQLLVD